MAEPDDPITAKRKASPEPSADDVTGKRIRLEDGNENASPSNGVDSQPQPQDGTASTKKEQDGPHFEGSPARADRAEPEHEPRHSPEARRPSATAGPPARRNFSMEEKKRGQRLFGGLVNTLSRTSSGSQQQKRLEIERRQQEKAQQRRAEDEKRRAERLEQLRQTRQIEQVKLDEQVYYRPWELTKEQEKIISDQIHTAEEAVDRERRDFKTRKQQRLRELGVTPPPRSPSPPPRQQKQLPQLEPETEPRSKEVTVGEPEPPPQDTNSDVVAPTPPTARIDPHDKDHDENGDEMMQDEEDIVIY
ncbi:hypothetical protein C8A00DRAFT_11264 [Chaetomidium leptoderma]|uniref:Pinin/SDK/MemA protein domain-containing protein n=1 Tax=Chaetomidium leptoderma TaxID=669021 RepID=A0AAN6VUJ5_9PEZI|nr:hypothetical protein C8A00DRAFT_11264 [Chaetomidium leptoderma]